MNSIQSQLSDMFGTKVFCFEDVRNQLAPEAERVIKECQVGSAKVAVSAARGGVELRVNLAEGWGIYQGRVTAAGARPAVDPRLVERLLDLPQVWRVVLWDTTGRYISEDRKPHQEDYSSASIPLMISTVVRKYSNESNREQFSEEFKHLEDSLTEAGSPDEEDLGRGMGRLTQEQINHFYGVFHRMPD